MFYQMVLDKITRPVEDTDEDEEFDVESRIAASLVFYGCSLKPV